MAVDIAGKAAAIDLMDAATIEIDESGNVTPRDPGEPVNLGLDYTM